jgi:hypothetical protein
MVLISLKIYSYFDTSTLSIHSDLELHVLHYGLQDAIPVLLERSVSMPRYRNSSIFILDSQLHENYYHSTIHQRA